MLIKYQALAPHSHTKKAALYVLIGDEPCLAHEAAKSITDAYEKNDAFERKIIDINTANDWSSVLLEANSYSLFHEKSLLDLRYDKKSIDVKGKKALQTYLEQSHADCVVVLRAPSLTSKTLSWLSNHPHVSVIQISPLTGKNLIDWLKNKFHALAINVEPQVPALIEQYSQSNMLAAAQMVEKISLVALDKKTFTVSELMEQLSYESNFQIYQLADACLKADLPKALLIIRKHKKQQTAPTLVLWVLAQEARQCLQLKQLTEQNAMRFHDACQKLKIWSSRSALYASSIKRFSPACLTRLLSHCHQLDLQIRSTANAQIWLEFERWAVSFCAATSHPNG